MARDERYMSLQVLMELQLNALQAAIELAKETGKFRTPDYFLFQWFKMAFDKNEFHNLFFEPSTESFSLRLRSGSYIDPIRWIIKGKNLKSLNYYFKNFGSNKAYLGELPSPEYLRARILLIKRMIAERASDDPEKTHLRNGVFPETVDNNLEIAKLLRSENFESTPLSFSELTSFNTWFTLYPEKVAGKEVLTSSREFPITIKGNKEDILRAIDQGMKSSKSTFEFILQLKKKAAKAKLKLINL